MILKPCPFCRKEIPRAMTACPYCHRDEMGKPVQMDSSSPLEVFDQRSFDQDLSELGSTDPFVRDQAVVRLAKKGFGVVQALLSILGDHAKPGLSGIAKALGRIGDRRAIPVLAQVAKSGDDELRVAAVWALAQFREPEVIPILMSEAECPHPATQSYLANVLGGVQDPRVLPVLRRLAGHPSREVCFQAACALGESNDPASIAALRNVYGRRDVLLRSAAAASLQKLGATVRGPWVFKGIALLLLLALIGLSVWWWGYR